MKKLLLVLLALPLTGFGQNVNIPDANFKAYLLGNTSINTNGDNQIQVTEATAFNGTIDCWGMGISNLTGIEAFTALTYLDCSLNQLSSLNLSQNTALTEFYCAFNQLTSLNVSQNTALTYLYCSDNQLTSLDVSQNTALTDLWCGYNPLGSLDVSQNTALTRLECGGNQLTSLNVNGATALTYLNCGGNQLTSLDVSQNTALYNLYCWNNQLTSLNVSQNTALTYLDCGYNQLECLDISNNINLTELNCRDNLLEQLNTRNGNWQNMSLVAVNNNLTCVEVDNIGYATNNWAGGFDSFVTFNTNCNYTNPCNTTSAIKEHFTNKELLKVTDLLGRETKGTKNEVLFYIYDDGTVEKRIVIE